MTVEHPLPDDLVELIAERFRALAEPTRIKLLDRLREGEATVQELTEVIGSTQQNVSKHLGVLRQAGMVRRRKAGNSSTTRSPTPVSLREPQATARRVARPRRCREVTAVLQLFQTEWCLASHRVRERLTELGLDYVVRQCRQTSGSARISSQQLARTPFPCSSQTTARSLTAPSLIARALAACIHSALADVGRFDADSMR
jgi:DNA-binding transcriptional ArsR family regulator